MFKKIIFTFLLSALIITACKKKKVTTEFEKTTFAIVYPDAETTAVTSNDDAADDPCIWINPKDCLQSTIIGTNKKKGLEVYNLDGKRLYTYNIGRVNNTNYELKQALKVSI